MTEEKRLSSTDYGNAMKKKRFEEAQAAFEELYPKKKFMLMGYDVAISNYFHNEGRIVVNCYYCAELRLGVQIDEAKRIYRIAEITDDNPIPPYQEWRSY